MKTALVLLLSLHLGSCCDMPDYMKGKTVPDYRCLDEDGDFQKRLYSPSFWIRTRILSADIQGLSAAKNTLDDFVKEKDRGQHTVNQFEKAWPVLINRTRDDQLWMSWFVQLEFVDSWLEFMSEVESDSEPVELLHLPESIFYICEFTGLPSLSAGIENVKKLVSWVNGTCPDPLEYSGAGYEPYLSITHHNEVWIEESSCSPSV